MQKYQVIKVDCHTNNIEILSTELDFKSAIEFLGIYLNKNFDSSGWAKCFWDNNSVSIYEYSYIFPKRLKYKLHISIYDDNVTPTLPIVNSVPEPINIHAVSTNHNPTTPGNIVNQSSPINIPVVLPGRG